jgi:integrase/recombinase XerC
VLPPVPPPPSASTARGWWTPSSPAGTRGPSPPTGVISTTSAPSSAPPASRRRRRHCCAPHGEANGAALAYRAHLVERGLQAATVNRRLAALRSLVRLANTLGLVPWTLAVEGVRANPYRDTRGPGQAAYAALLAAARAQARAKGARDAAILRLLHDLALRRGELVGLDLADVDLAGERFLVLGKGRSAREPLTLPAPTRAALEAWIATRGAAAGPLFTNFDRAAKGSGRLTGAAIYALLRALGAAAGVPAVRPHGLRHLAITSALDGTQGDLRRVQRFSRHRDIRVLTLYDDARRDMAGEIAALVAATAA